MCLYNIGRSAERRMFFMIESGIEYSCMKFHLAAMLFPVLKEEKNHTHCSYDQYMIQTVCCMFAIAVY